MFHTILVPLDGSRLAERALPFAEIMAKANLARILLLRVVLAAHRVAGDPLADQARAVREAEAYLTNVAAQITTQTIVESAVFVGDVADSIVEEIVLRNVDLVVMSTHGRSGVGRWVYGSVADEVMRNATVPVLLIPASCRVTWKADHIARLLVPLDGSDLAGAALDLTSGVSSSLGAELFLLRVVAAHGHGYGDVSAYLTYDPQAEAEQAREYLSGTADDLRARGHLVTVLTAIGPAAAMIAATAAEHGIELIVMSSHGSGGITRLLMGSVATGVVQQACTPVLIVRPQTTPHHTGQSEPTLEAEEASTKR